MKMATAGEVPRLDFLCQKIRGGEAQLEVASKHKGTAGGGGAPTNFGRRRTVVFLLRLACRHR
jgi:hypothetical protein